MYHQAGMEKSARKQFEAALAIQPDNAVAKQMLSLLKSETEAKAAPVPPKLPTKPQTPAAKSPTKTEKPEEPKKSLLQQDVGELFGKLFKR